MDKLPSKTHDVTEWETIELHRAARLLKLEMDHNPIPRQREAADQELGRVVFEVWARRHIDPQPEA